MIEHEFTLIKYRDAGMHTYTYFWVNEQRNIVSPYFDTEDEAKEWLNDKTIS